MKNRKNNTNIVQKGGKKKMEKVVLMSIRQFTCTRCGHKWPASEKYAVEGYPKKCPRCNSQYWNKPYQRKVKNIVHPPSKFENANK